MRKSLRYIFLAVVILLVIAAGGFILWGLNPAEPMPEARAALESDARVTVTSDSWLTFTPVGNQPDTGLVIYPGGHVDYRAYAPLAHELASQGILTVIVPMPLNLAVINPNAAAKVIAAHPEIRYWAVGGHSLGGAMAASYVYSHPGTVEGLVLWAAYPASNNDLSSSNVRVISIYGTLDGLATEGKIAASAPLLPPDTLWFQIEGGNHAQFGWYGEQSGDNPAAISRQDQQKQIVQATVAFLESLKN